MTPGMPMVTYAGQLEEKCRICSIRITDVLPPLYLPSYSCPSKVSKRYVAAFYCGDFWASTLTYLDFDGNCESLARLYAILQVKQWEEKWNCETRISDAHILNIDAPLSESVVLSLLAAEGETLRALLSAHFKAPFPEGWKDCNHWVVRNMSQHRLDGKLAILPRSPTRAYYLLAHHNLGWDSYPDRLVGFCLKEYIRAWPAGSRCLWRRVSPVDRQLPQIPDGLRA
jgi:hypothetical protein